MPQDFITWSYLGTFAGMAVAVFWLTQKSKESIDGLLGRWGLSLETDLLAWFWATLLTIVVWGQRGDLATAWNWALIPVNSLFVAIVAMGTHQAGASDGYTAALNEPIDADLTEADLAIAATPLAKKSTRKTARKETVADTESTVTPS